MESEGLSNRDPFINSETSQIFIELMNSQKGREFAQNLLKKFMALSQSFNKLNDSEKKLASIGLNQQFRDSLLLLKEKFTAADDSEENVDNTPAYHYYNTSNDLCTFIPMLVLVIFLIGELR